MKNISNIIVLILGLSCHAQDSEYIWKGVIKSQDNKKVEFANIQVKAKGHYYLFMTNNSGYVEIIYPKFNITDSVFISCIGYKTKKTSCAELKQTDFIILEEETYNVEEVIIKQQKYKIKKLGNKNLFTIRSNRISPNDQLGLYIPNSGVEGKVISVRVYMHSFSNKNLKYRPFRLRLFEGTYPFEKEITTESIIARLETKFGNWLEIDLTNFNINFPETGMLVVIEALPYSYVSIGTTADNKTRDNLICYQRYWGGDWKQIKDKHWYYLIQVKIKCEK